MEKDRTLNSLQTLIDQQYTALSAQSGDLHATLGDLETLLSLYNSVRNSPALPLEVAAIGRLAVGFVRPAIPSILQQILK